jgi:hypothetical protein
MNHPGRYQGYQSASLAVRPTHPPPPRQQPRRASDDDGIRIYGREADDGIRVRAAPNDGSNTARIIARRRGLDGSNRSGRSNGRGCASVSNLNGRGSASVSNFGGRGSNFGRGRGLSGAASVSGATLW